MPSRAGYDSNVAGAKRPGSTSGALGTCHWVSVPVAQSRTELDGSAVALSKRIAV